MSATLEPQHRELIERSAIDIDIATEAGVRSITAADQLPEGLRWVGRHRGGLPGLLFPWSGTNGQHSAQYRPDEPIVITEGDTRKYIWPTGSEPLVWVHPRMARLNENDVTDVVIVEGTKQYLAAVSAAGPTKYVVGISGCHGWMADGVPLAEVAALPVAGHRVVIIFDADLSANRNVWNAGDALGRHLSALGASEAVYVRLAASRQAGLDDYLAVVPTEQRLEVFDRLLESAGSIGRAPAKDRRTQSEPTPNQDEEEIDRFDDIPDEPGWQLLDDLRDWLTGYVAFQSPHHAPTVALWCAHTHAFNRAASTGRLTFESPEPESGKTRTMELMEPVCRNGRLVLQMSPASMYRWIEAFRPSILVDEIDAVFGPKASNDHEDLRSLINGGHRPGATVPRVDKDTMEVKEFPLFAPVALAGLVGSLPDTVRSRAIRIPMRRRAPDEIVRQWRERITRPEGEALGRRIAAWVSRHGDEIPEEPTLPDGVTDRQADSWEPLLAIAEAVGGDWPTIARNACQAIVTEARANVDDQSVGIRLLHDIYAVMGEADRITTAELLEKLHKLDDAPWSDWYGKAVTARWLAQKLKPYGIKPGDHKFPEDKTLKGYLRQDFTQVWVRYGITPPKTPTKGNMGNMGNAPGRDVAHVAEVADISEGNGGQSDTPSPEREIRLWD